MTPALRIARCSLRSWVILHPSAFILWFPAFWSFSLRHRILESPDARDLDTHFVAGLQEDAARTPDAGGSAGRDDVAGKQGHAAAQVLDQLGDVEDQVRHQRVLHLLVV